MSLSLDQRLVVPPDVLINVVENESVILNLKSERYFGLDEIGTAMWKALTGTRSIQAACDELLLRYDVEPDRLRQDVQELAEKLVEHGLLEVHSG